MAKLKALTYCLSILLMVKLGAPRNKKKTILPMVKLGAPRSDKAIHPRVKLGAPRSCVFCSGSGFCLFVSFYGPKTVADQNSSGKMMREGKRKKKLRQKQ